MHGSGASDCYFCLSTACTKVQAQTNAFCKHSNPLSCAYAVHAKQSGLAHGSCPH